MEVPIFSWKKKEVANSSSYYQRYYLHFDSQFL